MPIKMQIKMPIKIIKTIKTKLFKNSLIDYLAVFLLRTLALLPWRVISFIGIFVGYLLYLLPTRTKQVTTIQISKCFAHLNQTDLNNLIKKSVINIGRAMLENICSIIFKPQRALKLINEVHGLNELQNALNSKQAVVCLTSHLGNWEILNHYFGSLCCCTCFYRPLKKFKRLDIFIKNSRSQTQNEVVPSTKKGILTVIKKVKLGCAVGIPIDPEPAASAGVFAPFLGVQTLTSKFAHNLLTGSNNVHAFFMHAIRKNDGYFAVYIERAPIAMFDLDPKTSINAMSCVLAKYVSKYPDQYLWSMKRFKHRPNNEPKWY